jgi:hypothetical protein
MKIIDIDDLKIVGDLQIGKLGFPYLDFSFYHDLKLNPIHISL